MTANQQRLRAFLNLTAEGDAELVAAYSKGWKAVAELWSHDAIRQLAKDTGGGRTQLWNEDWAKSGIHWRDRVVGEMMLEEGVV